MLPNADKSIEERESLSRMYEASLRSQQYNLLTRIGNGEEWLQKNRGNHKWDSYKLEVDKLREQALAINNWMSFIILAQDCANLGIFCMGIRDIANVNEEMVVVTDARFLSSGDSEGKAFLPAEYVEWRMSK